MLNFVKSFLIVNKKGFGKVQREKLIHSKWLHRQQCWWRRFSSFLWGFRQRTFLQVYRQHKVTGHYIYIGPCPTVVTYNGCDLMRSYATQPQNGRGVNRSGPIPNRGMAMFPSGLFQLLIVGFPCSRRIVSSFWDLEWLWSQNTLFNSKPWNGCDPIRSYSPLYTLNGVIQWALTHECILFPSDLDTHGTEKNRKGL